MQQRFLETGQIVNTHGIHGEVKILPWADSPGFLCQFDTFYIDGQPIKLLSARPHKTMVLASLAGVDSVEKAMRLKGKIISVDRTQIQLPANKHFLADLMGLTVINAANDEALGTIQDILTLPAHNVYVVNGKGKKYMIPAVPAFIEETNVENGYVKVHLIEGLEFDV